MAKKAKFRVRGYFKDLMGWFKLMKRREEWIAAGDPSKIDLTDNPELLAPLRFLREREIIHFQRFGEALEIAKDYLNQQHYFFMQKNGCNTK